MVGVSCSTEAAAAVGWMGIKDTWQAPLGSLTFTDTITLDCSPKLILRGGWEAAQGSRCEA